MSAENFSLGGFTEKLASNAPTPGGGGAAALCAALSASLCSMAASLTVGKKKFAEFEADHRRIIADCDALRGKMLSVIDEDAQAFWPLSEVYSMPKDAEGYAEKLEAATLDAADPPLKLLRLCAQAAELIAEMNEKCSKLLISDVGCAAELCHAALNCAAMNVYVNTRCLKNEETAAKINAEVDAVLSDCSERMIGLANEIRGKLRDK